MGYFFTFIVQLLLILYLYRQHTLTMKKQLLDEEDKVLLEFSYKLPEIIRKGYEGESINYGEFYPYLPYLNKKLLEKYEESLKYKQDNTEFETVKKYLDEFQSLINDRRMEIRQEKHKLTEYSIKNLIPFNLDKSRKKD